MAELFGGGDAEVLLAIRWVGRLEGFLPSIRERIPLLKFSVPEGFDVLEVEFLWVFLGDVGWRIAV